MNPTEKQQFASLIQRVDVLEKENRSLKSSSTIPYENDQAHRERFTDLMLNSLSAKNLRVRISTQNVSATPADAEFDAAFGQPNALGEGFVGLVDDAGAGAAVYLCAVVNSKWWYESLTEAV